MLSFMLFESLSEKEHTIWFGNAFKSAYLVDVAIRK